MQQHERDLDAAELFHRQYQELLEARTKAKKEGLPALARLIPVAQRDTGQSAVIGRFLLGLYNSQRWPFPLCDLRCLDQSLHQDCMAVLAMDYQPEKEVHTYVPDGDRIWLGFIGRWGGGEA